jgi:hypothetical protein
MIYNKGFKGSRVNKKDSRVRGVKGSSVIRFTVEGEQRKVKVSA